MAPAASVVWRARHFFRSFGSFGRTRPAFFLCERGVAGLNARQVVADRCRALIAIFRVRREQLGNDGLERGRTFVAEACGRSSCADHLLEPPGVAGPERLMAAHHLIEKNAERPGIRLPIAVAALETLG
jgi:hypothetical protein